MKQNQNKNKINIVLLLGLLIIIFSNFVSADVLTNTSSYLGSPLDTNTAFTDSMGFAFKINASVNGNVTLTSVNKSSNTNCNFATLYYGCTTVANSCIEVYNTTNLTGNKFNFPNIILNKSLEYAVGCNSNGSSYTRSYKNYVSKIVTPYVNFTDAQLERRVGGNFYIGNLEYVFLTFNVSGSSVPIDYTPVFVNQTPNDISTTNIIGNPLIIIYNITQPNTSNQYINYTINGGQNIINGTIQNSYNQKNKINNTGSLYTFRLNDNNVYPAVYNINEETIENTPHYNITVTNSNEFYKVKLYGLNTTKQYNFLELEISTTGNVYIYYCNNTYVSGTLNTNNNCGIFASYSNLSFNHVHNNSKHNTFSLPFINGTIANVTVTPNSSFIIGKSSGTAYIGYINGSVPRVDTVQRTINLGQVWNNYADLIDLHVHQYSINDSFAYQVCSSNSSNTICSVFRNDTFDITNFPPTSFNTFINKQNFYYQENILITRTTPTSSSSNITSYNYTIVDSSLNYYRTINTSTNLSSLSYNINNMSTGYYYIKVVAKDNNSLTSNSFSEIFYLGSQYIEPCNQTITLNNSGVPVLFNWSTDILSGDTWISFYNNPLNNFNVTNSTGYTFIYNNISKTSYDVYINQNIASNTNCILTFCNNSYSRILAPCVNDYKLITYEDLNNCNVKYDYPLNNGTYEACVTPPNTDKDLWLIIIMLILWITGLILALIFAPILSFISFVISAFMVILGNDYFGTSLIGVFMIIMTTIIFFVSLFLKKTR